MTAGQSCGSSNSAKIQESAHVEQHAFNSILVLATTIVAHLFLAGAAPATESSRASPGKDVVTYEVVNYGSRENDVPVTFGSIFARSDVPREDTIEAVDARGAILPIQVDRKATHQDHSLRHAVVTLIVPHLSRGAGMPVTLRRTRISAAEEKAVSVTDLPPGFDTLVILNSGGHQFTASARSLLAAGKIETWLSGPHVGEWWVSGPLKDERGNADPHLRAQFGIRCYGKGQPLRLDVVVENDWTFVPHPRTEFYDAEIHAGGKTVFAKTGMIQPSHTRWRKGFWWNEPLSLYVKQNLDYLKKARVVPNYDPDLAISETTLAKMYGRFQGSDRSPMASGTVMKYMPTTGGRPDIAPLPQWQAMYLLSMDPRAYEMTLQNADLGASFPVHYKNEKSGLPITVEDDPGISTNNDLFGLPGQLEKPDTGGQSKTLVPDVAHQPSLDFIPYLVTGDRFYLEELQFWCQWNTMDTASEYHGHGLGLISWGEIRGQAWSLRTLAQAEYITPDGDALKPVLERQLKANIGWYETHREPDTGNKIGTAFDPHKPTPWDDGRSIAPWQDDYFTWSVGYVQSLGDIDAERLLRWKARFPVGRMIAPGFCWILATPYTMPVRDTATATFYPTFAQVYAAMIALKLPTVADAGKLECGSQAMANALKLQEQKEMINGSAAVDGYPSILQAGLAAAVDSGVPGAEKAWQVFQSRLVKPDYSSDPGWDIVPWRTSGMQAAPR